MKESVLKKQFAEKDIQRIRNLVKGKSGDRTLQGVGYTKKSSGEYEEGDIWEEEGKTWTIRNGIKENITKLDTFKQVSMPLFCPKCNKVMSRELDSLYYKNYSHCLDCQMKFETKLKIEGKWESYVVEKHNNEIDELIKAYNSFIDEKLLESNNGFITEQGDVEKWVGGLDKERIEQARKETIIYLESQKKQIK